MKWARDGDENSSFFHGVINKRRVSNCTPGIMTNGVWVTKPNLIKREVFSFFRDKFVEEMEDRPNLVCDDLKMISSAEAESLVGPFTKKEIKEAAFECGSDKAPGPDGFNFRFIKRFWHLFEDDFFKIFQSFHDTGKINKGVGSSFITLIPKVENPVGLGEYRPITLIGVISKVISKVLTNRLKTVMESVTYETQSAFLSGRYILDGPMIISEVMSWAKRRDKELFLFKIDFEKAYDNVHWGFLFSIMKQMRFPDRWCEWIHGVLASASSSVLVNGSPTFEFSCSKGIRQGDPISPFLFIIVMEALSSIIRKACRMGAFEGVRLPNNGPVLSHLLYADDAMVMGEWSQANFNSLRRILRVFRLCSGLRININKSTLYGIGKPYMEVQAKALWLGCRFGEFPFKYLGILVGGNMSRINSWDPVIQVFKKRLSLWKARILSMGGRLVLIKSVLESIPTYYFSMYKAPIAVINKLEGLIRRFLWGGTDEIGKIHWVAWDNVVKSKDSGGLGLSRLLECNYSMLFKWIWRYKVEDNAMWKQVIEAIHVSNRRWDMVPWNKQSSGPWSKIVKAAYATQVQGTRFINMIRGMLGDGTDIRFWLDSWISDMPLRDLFPNLFRLERNKWCKVVDRIGNDNDAGLVQWEWKRYPSSDDETRELIECFRLVTSVRLQHRRDSWRWNSGSNITYTVKETRKWLRNDQGNPNGDVYKWCKWIPSKCNVFMWRTSLDRIPTASNLIRRNINIGDGLCSFCGEVPESTDHIFTGCLHSNGLWSGLGTWLKLPPMIMFSVKDILQSVQLLPMSSSRKEIIYGIVVIMCWKIWANRNEIIFKQGKANVSKTIAEVKAISYLWSNSRSKKAKIDWKKWCVFDVT